MKTLNVKRDSILAKCLYLFLLLAGSYGSPKAQQVTMVHEGKSYIVPSQYLDPNFPSATIKSNNLKDSAYQKYLAVHRFPLPEEGDYERKVEIWLKNNHAFPQYLPSGNPDQDSLRYMAAVEFWKIKKSEVFKVLISRKNQTSLSDDDFDLLYKSFPRQQHSGNDAVDRKIYEEAVSDWIRVYSYEKYLMIEPIVRNEGVLNQNTEEKK